MISISDLNSSNTPLCSFVSSVVNSFSVSAIFGNVGIAWQFFEDRSGAMMGLANILLVLLGAAIGFVIAWLLLRPNAAVLNSRLAVVTAGAGGRAGGSGKIHAVEQRS